MRILLVLSLVLLWGCGPTGKMLQVAVTQCQINTPTECQDEWDALVAYEVKKEKQAEWDARFDCPDGEVYICGDEYCRSSRPRAEPPRGVDLAHSGCANRDRVFSEIERVLGGRRY